MARTVTTSEALVGLRSGLEKWATTAAGIARQASAATTNLVEQTESEVRGRAARVAAIEAALAAAPPEARGRLLYELRSAERSLATARRCLGIATDAARDAQVIQRVIDDSTGSRVPSAVSELGRKLGALENYAAVPPPSSSSTPAVSTGPVSYGVPNIVDIPLDQADFDDNPIGPSFRHNDADRGDYRWAVEKWDNVIRPGVLAGKTRADFEAEDNAAGNFVGKRRLGGVYDMFLGDDPVHVERRPDGTLHVTGGRHRVATAKSLGLTHIPAIVE